MCRSREDGCRESHVRSHPESRPAQRTISRAAPAARRLAAVLVLSAGLLGGGALHGDAGAQDAATGVAAVQTTLYFGLKTADGRGISEQQWSTFLAEVVTPRFPQGLTVVTAYGQGAGPRTDTGLAELTKVLIVVHPDDAAKAEAIAEIKAQYSREYGGAAVFHTEADVRIVP
jgi:hypothetical protein